MIRTRGTQPSFGRRSTRELGTHLKAALILVATLSLTGCQSESKAFVDDTFGANTPIATPAATEDVDSFNGEVGVFEPCDLVAPHGALAWLEISKKVQVVVPSLVDCSEPDPYAQSYYTFNATNLVSEKNGPPTHVDVVYFEAVDPSWLLLDSAQGTRIIASVRESGNTWFIDRWTFADVADRDGGTTFAHGWNQPIDLPDTWGELTDEAERLRSDFDALCGNPRHRGGLSDADYHEYRYVRDGPRPCGVDTDGDSDTSEGPTTAQN